MKTLIISLIVVLFIVTSCDTVNDEYNNYDYSIEQKMDCYCTQGGVWVKLYITADTVSAAARISDNYKLEYSNFWYYKSIKDLYNEIEETDTNDYNLIVEYDANNYPSYLFKEPKPIVINDTTTISIADGQIAFTTKNYIKLN
jgi:hypothetical protein